MLIPYGRNETWLAGIELYKMCLNIVCYTIANIKFFEVFKFFEG